MNKFSIYIYIDGPSFDSHLFNDSLSKGLSGHVHPIHRMVNGSKKVIGKFWKSKILHPSADAVEADLVGLIRAYRASILHAKSMGAERIYAEIVCHMKNLESLHGYFISKELITLLSELGMELDIDVVPMVD